MTKSAKLRTRIESVISPIVERLEIYRGIFLSMARASFLSVPIWSRTLVVRFAALWIALIVALVLPPSREMLRFHIIGSDVAPQFYDWSQPWNGYSDDYDPSELVKQEPENAALAFWDMLHQSEWRSDNYYYEEDYLSGTSKNQSKAAFTLVKKFPDNLWLKGYALRSYISERQAEFQASLDAIVPPPPTRPVPLNVANGLRPMRLAKTGAIKTSAEKYKIVQECAKLEPDNAFWPICEAYFRILELNYNAANRLLSKAARCSVYDDKSLEAARELIRVQSRFRSLSWEEKKVLYEDANEESGFLTAISSAVNDLREHSLLRDSYPQKVQISTNLMRIGALLQSGNNSIATCLEGMRWQQLAWRLGNPSNKQATTLPNGNRLFVAEMQKRGYPELAKEATRMKGESDALRGWISRRNNESWGFTPVYLNEGGLATRANTVRDGGMLLVAFFGYLILWWSFLNIFMFRGKGIASTRRERIVPVLIFAALFLTLAASVGWWFTLVWNGSTPRSPRRDEAMVIVGVFAFAGMPFVLAIFCALATMRRYKSEFALPPRVDMELQLSLFYRNLLRWMLPFAVLFSIATLIIGWLFLTLAVLLDWGRINVLAWMPPDRNGLTGDLSFHPIYEPYPLVYGLIMCGVCLGVWFLKWRFFSPKELKFFTHTGLRRWKETIGIAIIATIGVYIIGSVCLWPTRLELENRMEKVLTLGPLSQRTK